MRTFLGLGMALLATSVVGCSVSASPDHSRSLGGPMTVSLGGGGGGGGLAMRSPRPGEAWTATFGGFKMCSNGPPSSIRLERLTFTTSTPVPHSVFLRVVTAHDISKPKAGYAQASAGAALGSPPRFQEPYARAKFAGTFTSHVTGASLTRRCGTDERAPGYEELLLSLRIPPSGVVVHDFKVLYRVGSRQYERDVDWTVTACGADTVKDCAP